VIVPHQERWPEISGTILEPRSICSPEGIEMTVDVAAARDERSRTCRLSGTTRLFYRSTLDRGCSSSW
jgi:hypothetical protein